MIPLLLSANPQLSSLPSRSTVGAGFFCVLLVFRQIFLTQKFNNFCEILRLPAISPNQPRRFGMTLGNAPDQQRHSRHFISGIHREYCFLKDLFDEGRKRTRGDGSPRTTCGDDEERAAVLTKGDFLFRGPTAFPPFHCPVASRRN